MANWAPPPAPSDASPIADAIVEVTNVTKSYGDVVAVSDVSFTVGPGSSVRTGPGSPRCSV